ncbi:hypothetical protein MKX03_015513 [Papaver bracteatum]|nr:hypothetical protein MKX03_015513 [Papaver bracteatum]
MHVCSQSMKSDRSDSWAFLRGNTYDTRTHALSSIMGFKETDLIISQDEVNEGTIVKKVKALSSRT